MPTIATIKQRRPGATAAVDTASAARTLTVSASATLLVLATFTAIVTTVGDSARALNAGVAGQTWALSAMSLGLAAALLTVGALGDDFGRRRILIWSAGGLAAASAVGALAPSIGLLVAARIAQGITGAGVLASSLSSIGHAFPAGASRTRATGIWAAAVGGGIALGPLVGAELAAALGWRSDFWIEAVASAGVVLAASRMAESRAVHRRRLDIPGAVTLAGGMAALTAALVEGRTSWSAPLTVALSATGVLLLAAFVAVEVRGAHPMLELRLFKEPQFVVSITGAFVTGLAVIGLMSYAPTMMQHALHVSIVGSAGVLALWSGTSMVVALAARRLPSAMRSHTRLAVGLALCGLGELALTTLGDGAGWSQLAPGLLLAGIGSGIANAALGRLAVESVPHERAGMGSGANNTARYLGGAAGVALVVALGASGSAHGLLSGWDVAAGTSAGLCAIGALTAALLR